MLQQQCAFTWIALGKYVGIDILWIKGNLYVQIKQNLNRKHCGEV